MGKIKYTAGNLLDSIDVSATIECTKCNNQDSLHACDEYDASPIFFERGWRATLHHTYCPDCAKKYLKI